MKSIQGIQETQQANLRQVAAMQPSGRFGEMIRQATLAAQRYAVMITHVDTGTLRASHRVEVMGLRGQIYIDPVSISPKGGRPAVYGVAEHNRGGSHAFYARTESEAGERIAQSAIEGIRMEFERR